MRRWDPLNELQLSVLSKIAEGVDLSSREGAKYRRSAYALRDRGLVTAGRKQGRWQAHVTDAGRFYLKHGHHPDRPSDEESPKKRERPAEVERKRARASRSTPSDDAAKLIADLNAAGGVLRFESPDGETRAHYRRVIDRAKRYSLVPEGTSLRYTGRSAGDLVVCLIDPANGGETEWNKIRTTTGSTHTGTAAALEELRRDPSSLKVSEALLPRALTVVESLGKAMSRKGYRLVLAKRRSGTTLFVTVNGHQYDLTVAEERERVGKHSDTRLRPRSLNRYLVPRPAYELRWTGRLTLVISPEGYADSTDWSDKGRRRLENQVRDVVPELEHRSKAADEARLARERQLKEWEEQERRRRLREQAEWEEAMADATEHAIAARRSVVFREALEAWNTVNEIRGFCRALEKEAQECGDSAHAERLMLWARWGEETAERWDPVRSVSGVRSQDFDAAPSPDELRPFLGDWSPHGPRREYRYRTEPEETDHGRYSRSESWHYRQRGRPQWWRR
ncbi:hypothetical protein [Nocardiopsis sp. FR4]|uniref:hypothetical protein n=1 Tax=Nocardiopsis sp. FR4 TaxID=2605985 RepID=UPI0013592B73|nr:hypothetical protein [Nocardiopsis sp. FR4]